MFSDSLLLSPAIAGAIGLVLALLFYIRVKSQPGGNETMERIVSIFKKSNNLFIFFGDFDQK